MMPKKMVKGIAIGLAVIMFLSILAVITQVIAIDSAAVISTPVTGDNVWSYIVPVVVLVIAVVAIITCVVYPKLNKKNK